jgi:integrase
VQTGQDGKPKLDKQGEPLPAPKHGFHALRHAAACLFIEQDWTPKKVQTVLGRASLAMTYDRYGKLFKDGDSDRKAMAEMPAALLG